MKFSWTRPSLSRDFVLLSAVIVFLLMMVSMWLAYETFDEHSRNIAADLEREARRIDHTLTIEIENASYLLKSLGMQIATGTSRNPTQVADVLKSFDMNPSIYHMFSWINADQQLVISSNKGILDKPIDVSDRDYLKKSIAKPWEVQIGRPTTGRVSEKWIIPVGMGLTDQANRYDYIGTLLVSLDINILTDEINALVNKSGISFAIVSQTFVPLTRVSHDENFIVDNFPEEKLAELVKVSNQGIFSEAGLFSKNSLYTYYYVSSRYPYIILLGYDTRAGEDVIRGMLLPRLWIVVFMAIFLITVIWAIRKRVIRPVMELSDVVIRVARGEPFTPLKETGPEEIEELGMQIRRMSEYIAERKRIEDELQNKIQLVKKAKEGAELTNRIKAEFLACMNQELKAPVTAIVGFSEVMKDQLYGPIENKKYRQYAQDIYQSGTQLLEIIDDMLALSKTDAGLLELQEKPVDIEFVLNRCVRLLADKIDQQKVSVKLYIQDNLPRLVADELRLKQIMLNLLSNAVKFSPEGSEVTVEAKLENDEKNQLVLALVFIDHGVGMQPHEISALTDNPKGISYISRSETGEGGGLGLFLTRTLVQMHQGRFQVESIPGQGTVVSVMFPKERLVFKG